MANSSTDEHVEVHLQEMVGDVRGPDLSETDVQESHESQAERDTQVVWLNVVILLLSTLALDQWSKRLIIDWLGQDSASHRWELTGKYLAFEYVENTGAAFGLFAGRTWLLSALALCVASTFFFLFRSAVRRDSLLRAALGLLLGGAAGNVLDRIRMGHVTDFVAVGNWPKFNLADSAITLGIALITASMLREIHPMNDAPTHSA